MRASGRSAAWARYTLPTRIRLYEVNHEDCFGVVSRYFELVFGAFSQMLLGHRTCGRLVHMDLMKSSCIALPGSPSSKT